MEVSNRLTISAPVHLRCAHLQEPEVVVQEPGGRQRRARSKHGVVPQLAALIPEHLHR